jgi:hypothetical protein
VAIQKKTKQAESCNCSPWFKTVMASPSVGAAIQKFHSETKEFMDLEKSWMATSLSLLAMTM